MREESDKMTRSEMEKRILELLDRLPPAERERILKLMEQMTGK